MQNRFAIRSATIATCVAAISLLIGSAGLATAGDLEWAVPPVPIAAKVEVITHKFECLNGHRFTTERELSYPVCLGALPATCTQTVSEIFECRNGQYELVHSWTSDPDCGYDADGTVCEMMFELEEPIFLPIDPGPYADPGMLEKFESWRR